MNTHCSNGHMCPEAKSKRGTNGPGIHSDTRSVLQTEVLTVGELAAVLQVRVSWVYRHANELGALRLGKYLRFVLPDVIELLKGQGTASSVVKPSTLRPNLNTTKSINFDEQGTTREQKNS